MNGGLDIVVERWWIRDAFNPPDLAWKATISHPQWGITSAADETPWRAIARAGAYLVLKQHGLDRPTQAQDELSSVIARARAAAAVSESMPVKRPAKRPAQRPARPRRAPRRRTA